MNEDTNQIQERRVSDSTDLQEKVKAGADLVALGKENGYPVHASRTAESAGWKELQESDLKDLTEFELDVTRTVDVVRDCLGKTS